MDRKKDPWKDLVEGKKDSFDSKEPKDLWSSIESRLDQEQKKEPKTIELWKVYRIAAVLVVVIAVAFFALFQKEDSSPLVAEQEHEEKNQSELYFPEELLEVESFYVSEIEEKLKEVKKLTDDELIVQEIQLLKDEFDELKLELGDQVNDAEVIEAMIMNYRLRLDLLKEILSDLKVDENPTNEKMNYEAI